MFVSVYVCIYVYICFSLFVWRNEIKDIYEETFPCCMYVCIFDPVDLHDLHLGGLSL